jgi:hypothetical protein
MQVGMGIKGGIARKVMKVILDIPLDAKHVKSEISGEFDIDIIVLVENNTKELEMLIRKELTGMSIGGMIIEAKDIEVILS